jgi:calcium-dependent protein kinase
MSKKLPSLKREFLISSSSQNIREYYRFIGGNVGEGSYGIVRIARRLYDGVKRAIKIIPKSRVHRPEVLIREITILKQVDHPNIVKLYETYEDNRYIYLVMELMEGGELFDRIIEKGHFTEEEAARLFQQMLSAINYLHKHKIAHRDLKPENFLFASDSFNSPLKLIDFGFAKNLRTERFMTTKAGTAYYISPEVLTGIYTEKCDIWSIGVILYMMLSGYPPFDGKSDAEILEKVRIGTFTFSQREWREVSADAKDLVTKMLDPIPPRRISAADALKHPWLTNFLDSPKSPLVLDIVELRKYQNFNKLKKAVLNYIATQLSDNEIAELVNLFNRLDTNRDGMLSVTEFTDSLSSCEKLSSNEIDRIARSVDLDGSGTIDYTEFLAATLDQKLYCNEEKLWNAFKRFDIENTGKISADNLRHVLDSEGLVDDPEVWDDVIRESDKNRDGVIDFEDFLKMMQEITIERSPLLPKNNVLSPF